MPRSLLHFGGAHKYLLYQESRLSEETDLGRCGIWGKKEIFQRMATQDQKSSLENNYYLPGRKLSKEI